MSTDLATNSATDSSGTRSQSGFQLRLDPVYALRFRHLEIWLLRQETVIGRSADCDIMLDGAPVSRRHAKVTVQSSSVTIEDLDSRNGVYVNSRLIDVPTEIFPEDVLLIGDSVIELVKPELKALEPTPERVTAIPPQSELTTEDLENDERFPLSRTELFQVLSRMADESLLQSQPKEAELLIAGQLKTALRDAALGIDLGKLPSAAAIYALKLARATRQPEWLNYTVQLYQVLGRPMPLPVIDELEVVLQRVSGLDVRRLDQYVAGLEAGVWLEPDTRQAIERLKALAGRGFCAAAVQAAPQPAKGPSCPFFSQASLEDWSATGAIELDGSEVFVKAEGLRYQLVEGVTVLAEVTGSADAHDLVGKAKSLSHVTELGAELLGTSMIIGDNAYEVEPGWIAKPMSAASGDSSASEPSPVSRPLAKSEADLLVQFLMRHY